MLQFTVDLTKLAQNQREILAGFLLNFPEPGPSTLTDEDDKQADTIKRIEWFGQIDRSIGEDLSGMSESTHVSAAGPQLVIPPPPTESEAPSGLDKNGIPWDERIHSSNHEQTEKGIWRKRRGVTDELVASVEAELKQLVKATIISDKPVGEPEPVADLQAAFAPGVIAPPPAEIAVVSDKPIDPITGIFIPLMDETTKARAAGIVSVAEIKALCMAADVADLPALIQQPDKIATIAESIRALIKSRS